MRDFKNMKRQRGRNRKPGGGGGSTGGGGGGGGGSNNPNRAFESNGPEGLKTRGNAQHVYERYQQLARDAFTSGDRVLAENYLQHAEHYFRVLRTIQPQRPVSEIAARDAFASGFDIDFEDENGNELTADGDGDGNNDGGEGDNGDQMNDRGDYRNDRNDRGSRENRDFRNEQPRESREFGADGRDQARDQGRDQNRGAEGDNGGDQPREPRPAQAFGAERAEGEGGGRREGRRERFERRRNEGRGDQAPNADPLAVVEPRGASLPTAAAAAAPSPALRDDDGAESHLPAFLRQPAAPADEPAAERPRRAPRRKKVVEGDASVEPAEEQA
jgi:hypothetical protein